MILNNNLGQNQKFDSKDNLDVFVTYEKQQSIKEQLMSVSLAEFDQTSLSQQQIQVLKFYFGVWFELFFNNLIIPKGFFSQSNNQFSLVFDWFWNSQIGFILENILYKALVACPSRLEIFKTSFLGYQRDFLTFFEPKISLENNPGGLMGIFYTKVNLLKVIRLLLNAYNPEFWHQLNSKEKFNFSNKIVKLTLKEGSYRYINSLFSPIVYEPKKTALLRFDESSIEIDFAFVDVIAQSVHSVQTQQPTDSKSTTAQTPKTNGGFYQQMQSYMSIKALVEGTSAAQTPKTNGGFYQQMLAFGSLLSVFAAGIFGSSNSNLSWWRDQGPTLVMIADSRTGSAVLPFATITGSTSGRGFKPATKTSTQDSPKGSTKKSIQARSRQLTPGISATTRALDLSSKARKFVTLAMPKATDLKVGANIPVTVSFEGSKGCLETQTVVCQIASREKKLKGLVPPSQVELMYKDEPFLRFLYKSTPLGIQHADDDFGRNFGTDLAIVDSAFSTNLVEGNVILNYDEMNSKKVQDYILNRCGRHIINMAHGEVNNPNKSELFQHVCNHFDIDENSNTEAISDEKIISFMKDTFKVSKSQAAHITTKKIADVVGELHQDQITMYTMAVANGPISYDSPEVNYLPVTTAREVGDLITSNLEIGDQKVRKALAKAEDSNQIATGLMADVCLDSYRKGRVLIANMYQAKVMGRIYGQEVETALIQGQKAEDSTTQHFINRIVAPFFSYNTVIRSHCLENLEECLKMVQKQLTMLESYTLPSDSTEEMVPASQGAPHNSNYGLKDQTNLIQFELALNTFVKSYNAIPQLALVNSLNHSIICSKPMVDAQAFLKKILLAYNSQGLGVVFFPTTPDEKLVEAARTEAASMYSTRMQLFNTICAIENKLQGHIGTVETALKSEKKPTIKAELQKVSNEYAAALVKVTNYRERFQNLMNQRPFESKDPKDEIKSLVNLDEFGKALDVSQELIKSQAPDSLRKRFVFLFQDMQQSYGYNSLLEAVSPVTSDWLHTRIVSKKPLAIRPSANSSAQSNPSQQPTQSDLQPIAIESAKTIQRNEPVFLLQSSAQIDQDEAETQSDLQETAVALKETAERIAVLQSNRTVLKKQVAEAATVAMSKGASQLPYDAYEYWEEKRNKLSATEIELTELKSQKEQLADKQMWLISADRVDKISQALFQGSRSERTKSEPANFSGKPARSYRMSSASSVEGNPRNALALRGKK